MPICDAHTHFFSRTYFDTLARQGSPGEDPNLVLQRMADQAGIELPDRDDNIHRDKWLADLERCDVEMAVTFASLPEEAETVANAARSSNGRLIPYGVVNPLAPDAHNQAHRMLTEWGFRGLIFFPALHHYHVDDERCRPLLTLAADHGAVVVVHCGTLLIKLRDLAGFPNIADSRYSNPLDCVPVAQIFPDLPIVIPHFGGGYLRETMMAAVQCPNLYVDTSSSNNWMQTQPGAMTLTKVFAMALECFGPDRILFGTDSSVFPRGWRADLLESQRLAMNDAGFDEGLQKQILSGNLRRLLTSS